MRVRAQDVGKEARADVGERLLWQSVLLLGVMDAVSTNLRITFEGGGGDTRPSELEQRKAAQWITRGGRDFRMCCALAGIDADMIRDRFMAGQIDGSVLKGKFLGGRPTHKQGVAA